MIIADLHYLEEERSKVIQMLADLDHCIDKVKKIIATENQYADTVEDPVKMVQGSIIKEIGDREGFLIREFDSILPHSEKEAWYRVVDSIKYIES